MKVWLDDERPVPLGWVGARSAHEAIALLRTGQVPHLSLDHDLGDDPALGTGYDVACFVEAEAFHGRLSRFVHSATRWGSSA